MADGGRGPGARPEPDGARVLLALLRRLEDGLPVVLPALHADPVREPRLAAVRAGADQRLVHRSHQRGSAVADPASAHSSFLECHECLEALLGVYGFKVLSAD